MSAVDVGDFPGVVGDVGKLGVASAPAVVVSFSLLRLTRGGTPADDGVLTDCMRRC